MTPDVQPRHRWTQDGFLKAWEAGAFEHARVELVDGQLWPVSIGSWHGDTTMRVGRALPNADFTVTSQSLVLASSVVDPDVWVRPSGSTPSRMASRRLAAWDAADVRLVVEVGDETLQEDLTIKARLYGAAGFVSYWVVGREGVHEHTGPTPFGNRHVRLLLPGDTLTVPYADLDLDVSALLG